ncbi:flagellar basal body P-ring formation chaperone FlgA [Pontibaca salina]|uniref:Flagella basal body P-ring formation protein FlgA n=1 Tax=Pontibaca salina TaxID=2795731 RepID=A0A934HRL6_9RHOB|nr:flagellar basal body P-ring formation chaperone FlgA [Pontibaca salina]MBI6629390.1 flagellar basal body P-ring formation protein FlgA [Pontibaca salina]
MKPVFTALLIGAASGACADIVVPVRTIRAKEIISADDLILKPENLPGAVADPRTLIGQEARVALYPGRAIHKGDIAPATLVERNEITTLVYIRGGLHIVTEGRALGRGAAGDMVRAMNLSSRTTITGTIQTDGSIEVQ